MPTLIFVMSHNFLDLYRIKDQCRRWSIGFQNFLEGYLICKIKEAIKCINYIVVWIRYDLFGRIQCMPALSHYWVLGDMEKKLHCECWLCFLVCQMQSSSNLVFLDSLVIILPWRVMYENIVILFIEIHLIQWNKKLFIHSL